MIRTYPIGDQILATATFLDMLTGIPRNPSNVVLRLRDPNGVEQSANNVTNPGVGTYMSAFTPTVAGNWTLRWEGTGVVVAAIENDFEVRPSKFSTPA